MTTLADARRSAQGRPSGFDYLRFYLAVSIVIWHTVEINNGRDFEVTTWSGPLRPFIGLILPMFFALSGFLVAGSLARTQSVASFLFLRIIRIFPALIVEVTLSAIVIGFLFSTLPVRQYIATVDFWHYFLNIFGDIHYELPGVFSTNPLPNQVNAQLWTIPFELKCYIALACLGLFRLHRKTLLFLIIVVTFQLSLLQRMLIYGELKTAVPGNVLVLCFLFSVVLYLYRDRVPCSAILATAAGVICFLCLNSRFGGYFVALPTAYLTVYLGLLNPSRIGLPKGGDYSYGIYLYGFPIQQAVAALGDRTHSFAYNIALAGPLIAAVAYLSWHFIEAPALAARKLMPAIDKVWLKAEGHVKELAKSHFPFKPTAAKDPA